MTETLTKTPSHNTAVISTLPSQASTRMSFDQDAVVHLMGVLTDLYSNPNLAVLREYATNALDSHAAAGNTAPIEIIMPSRLEPTFVVTDHGTGMSKDEILDIYSRYGASTKRNDLTQVGAFGLGCKSALTLTQQFTLVSVKNGERSVVVISRDEDGVGNVSIVDHRETDEPNGVTVTVPIPEVWRFNDAAKGFFTTWKPGTVLVDGTAPKSIYDEGYIESDGVYFSMDRYGNGIPSLIIGGIAYNVDSSVFPHAQRPRVNAYIETPIGAVDLTPSREALRYSERTKRYIMDAITKVSERVLAAASNNLQEAATRADALKAWEHWASITPQANQVEWRGEKCPTNIEESFTVTYCVMPEGGKRTPWTTAAHLPSGALRQSYYIVGVADDSERERVQRSLKLALGEMNLNQHGMVVYFSTEPKSPWIVDNANMVRLTADDIFAHAKAARSKARKNNAASVANGTRTPVRRAEYYLATFNAEGKTESHSVVTIDAIPTDVLYVDAKTVSRYVHTRGNPSTYPDRDMVRIAEAFMLSGKSVVLLRPGQSATALSRRLRLEPNALLDAQAWLKKQVKALTSDLSNDVKAYMVVWQNARWTRDQRAILDALEALVAVADSIEDKDVRSLTKLAEVGKRLRVSNWCTDSQIHTFSRETDKSEVKKVEKLLARVCKTYPLLGIDTSMIRAMGKDVYAQHALTYVNTLNAR